LIVFAIKSLFDLVKIIRVIGKDGLCTRILIFITPYAEADGKPAYIASVIRVMN